MGKKVQRLLTMNSIAFSEYDQTKHTTTSQRYRVLVYELEVLAVYRRQLGASSRYERIQLDSRSKAMSRLCRKAIRAVYCVGLDIAVVTLALQDKGDYAVLVVDAKPCLTSVQQTLLTEAIINAQHEDSDELAQNKRALIGMDPEFMLCRPDGKVVSAAQYLQRNGRAGYDGIRVRGQVVYPYVELRPKPSTEPRQLIIHLMQAMHDAARQINNPDLSWIAGGMPKKGFRLGGHIHMSGIKLTSRLLRALDNYLALPLILIEADSARGRRPRYGFLGDFRRQFHGGFEYRTLPSWLISPRIAKGVIALARLIADHYRELKRTPLQYEHIQRYYYNGDKKPLVPIVQQLWLDIENTSSYPHYATYLLPLKHDLFSLKAWQETNDIRRYWRIPPYD